MHQRFARRRFNLGLLAAGTGLLLPRTARAVPTSLTLGLQTGGTAAWGVKAMQLLGLPERHGLALSVRPLADSAAGQNAINALNGQDFGGRKLVVNEARPKEAGGGGGGGGFRRGGGGGGGGRGGYGGGGGGGGGRGGW